MAGWKSDRRIYVDRKGRLVDAGYNGPKNLLVAEGKELSDADCKRYGLGKYDKKAGEDTSPGKGNDQAEDQAQPEADEKPKGGLKINRIKGGKK